MARGRLITIEGIDGAGKSTLAAGLLAALRARGSTPCVMREPGGVATAERIRALVKDPEAQIGARAEALLYAAARAQLVHERLVPSLTAGTTVLLDRFVDSSLVYQGVGRVARDRRRPCDQRVRHRRADPGPDAAADPVPGARPRPVPRA